MFKIVYEMPSSGQFIMVWEYNKLIWSQVFRFDGNKLQNYISEKDLWEDANDDELDFALCKMAAGTVSYVVLEQ